ncbi:MAG: S8 family serine peptidase [Deltaproteobacteria bacterium]|nr:S8 family serine peptidase [Deltaproteobacteria bacterium]
MTQAAFADERQLPQAAFADDGPTGRVADATNVFDGIRTSSPLSSDLKVLLFQDGSHGVLRTKSHPNDDATEATKASAGERILPLIDLGGGAKGFWTGRVLLNIAREEREQVLAKIATRGWLSIRPLHVKGWVLVDVQGEKMADVDAVLASQSGVLGWHFDAMRKMDVRQIAAPQDPLFEHQWHLKNRAHRPNMRMTSGADIDVESVWGIQTRGNLDTIIAVLDTGQDLGHPDFAPINGEKEVFPFDTLTLSNDSTPDDDDDPSSAHGIACAGLAAANAFFSAPVIPPLAKVGTVGVCPECAVMPIRILTSFGFTTDTAVIDAFVHAVSNGADVISNSWGFIGAAPYPLFDVLEMTVKEGRGGKGAVVLFALGNSGVEAVPYEVANDP